jgi:hypothetical protein
MNKLFITYLFCFMAIIVSSCELTVTKSDKKDRTERTDRNDPEDDVNGPEDEPADDGPTEDEPSEDDVASNQAKSYKVIFSPQQITLGKNDEAVIKLKNGKALELLDADGKVTGIELNYDIELKNENELGGNSVYIYPSYFRLQLDNENIIQQEKYTTVSAEPQSNNVSTGNRFRLPPGTKPVSLSLFFDETRTTVKVSMK